VMLRVIGVSVGGALAVLAALTALTARSGDAMLWPPPAGAPAIEIHVVSHGYHAGVVLPRAAMAEAAARRGDTALIAVAQRFADYRWLEMGWGGEEFYRSVPDAASLTFRLAVRALFLPGNASVLHVVGLNSHPRDAFPTSDIVRAGLSSDGFDRLLDRLDASLRREPGAAALEPLGPGIYGASLFYRGVETFHVLNVCNHWVARLLSAAGLPTGPGARNLAAGIVPRLEMARRPRAIAETMIVRLATTHRLHRSRSCVLMRPVFVRQRGRLWQTKLATLKS
jgi:uncharacterized protein (TIGR02117 family)